MVQSRQSKRNALHDLGYKIFLDRYALKDMTRETLAVGDTVIVVVNAKTGQREVGTVKDYEHPSVTVELLDGEVVTRDLEHVDKPLETDPSEMHARVARGIADIEKTKKAKKEWEKNFQWLLDDWKFVPGGRILTAAGTDQALTFYNCMPPQQEILTSDGYKPIADVRIGDLVVTHKNRLRPVLHKFERDTEEPIYIIRPRRIGYDDLRVTGDHKVYVIRSEWVNRHRSRDGLRLAEEPQWIPAKDIKLGDYVSVAYNGEECPPNPIFLSDYLDDGYRVSGELITRKYLNRDVTNQLELDEDLCYLFGRWLGDGCITHRSGTDIPSGIKIVFSLAEKADADKLATIIENKFGLTAAIKLSSTERWYDLWVNSMPIGQFFKAFMGAYSHSKFIPDELMHLPRNLTMPLLQGLFQADGYSTGKYLGIVLSNRDLCIQVHQLLLRMGYFFTIRENTHRLGTTPAYRISATGSVCDDLFEYFFNAPSDDRGHDLKAYIEYDDLQWVRINEIVIEDYSGVVMDIEVAEDHSFVSAGVVVSNCYVIPPPQDSRQGILKTLGQMTEIMSRGGGVGINISTLRPRHAYVKGVNGRSSGSVSWGALYSFVTGLIEQGGSRRGALMLILNDWHPDVFDFINSKREAGNITNANISVGVSDKLMEAIKHDADWDLIFPDTSDPDYNELWDGDIDAWVNGGHAVLPYKTIKARELWDAIIESAWASAEPGVWFNERSNKMANSWYFNPLIATNPCGEQPLGGFSVCNLGAINLSKFYDEENDAVAWDDLKTTIRYATRFLDNVIDATPYFFPENAQVQGDERRVGLGTMGIAELMIKLKIRYGSHESLSFIEDVYKFIATESYRMSSEIAKEKGAFPKFDAEKFLESGFMLTMPEDIRQEINENGIRNVTLLTQAPTGTTGTMVNTSTGIEPFFSWVYYRKSRLGLHEEQVPLVQEYYAENPDAEALPDYFATAMDLNPREHVRVQGAFQKWIDSAISKTANLPNDYTVEQVSDLYQYMYELGCKGGTVYRDGSRDEQVLMLKGDERAESEMDDMKAKVEKPEKVEHVATPHRVYPRPNSLTGVTVRADTPFGTAYITLNSDEHGYPFEVFVTAPGKAGSDLQADAEGLGRMISLSLRTTAPQNRVEMVRLIIDQLRGIGGARSFGFGMKRVLSLPDALASSLESHYFPHEEAHQLGLPMTDMPQFETPKDEEDTAMMNGNGKMSGADMCPSCGTISLLRAEGCKKCVTCGYSEC